MSGLSLGVLSSLKQWANTSSSASTNTSYFGGVIHSSNDSVMPGNPQAKVVFELPTAQTSTNSESQEVGNLEEQALKWKEKVHTKEFSPSIVNVQSCRGISPFRKRIIVLPSLATRKPSASIQEILSSSITPNPIFTLLIVVLTAH